MPQEHVDSPAAAAERFEQAATRFLRECVSQSAREAVYQGWLTAFLAAEFGWAHVYREVHVQATDLLDRVPHWPLVQRFARREGQKKGALNLDISISMHPGMECRTSFSRPEAVSGAAITDALSVIGELKVAGTVKNPQAQRGAIERDIAKLGLYAAAAQAGPCRRAIPLAAYLIVLDNFVDPIRGPTRLYNRTVVEQHLDRTRAEWMPGLAAPVLLVGSIDGRGVAVDVYCEFRLHREIP